MSKDKRKATAEKYRSLDVRSIRRDGTIAGKSGFIYFIDVESAQQTNGDIYLLAVAEACEGKPIYQAQFWINEAPTAFPLTADQAGSKVVHWQ
jgi:hypothetical protein